MSTFHQWWSFHRVSLRIYLPGIFYQTRRQPDRAQYLVAEGRSSNSGAEKESDSDGVEKRLARRAAVAFAKKKTVITRNKHQYGRINATSGGGGFCRLHVETRLFSASGLIYDSVGPLVDGMACSPNTGGAVFDER
jgi:hypothetical protein